MFATLILPKHFKHSNFQSFVRQLHIYDFHKTSTLDPSHVGYANDNFRQGNPELLSQVLVSEADSALTCNMLLQIKRKANTNPNKPASSSSSRLSSAQSSGEATVSSGESRVNLGRAASVALTVSEELGLLRHVNEDMKRELDDRWDAMEAQFSGQLVEQETRINELRSENRRLRDVIGQLRSNQRRVVGKWEGIMQSIHSLFEPDARGDDAWESFDVDRFHDLIHTASVASRDFFSSVERDAKDVLSLGAALDESDSDFGALFSPKQELAKKEGEPISYTFSFDAAASRVAAPVPPVPKYEESSSADKQVVGGEAMSRQSSFELFSTYVAMFGQPVDTNQDKLAVSTSSKRPFVEPVDTSDKRARRDEEQEEGFSAQHAESFEEDLHSVSRFNSLDAGLGSPLLPFSRLNSLDAAILGSIRATEDSTIKTESPVRRDS